MTLHLTLVPEATTVRAFSALRSVARFENRGKKKLSAVIHATPLSHGEYSFEVQDAGGKPVAFESFGMCGTMAPLMEHEIFLVEPGASVATPVHPPHGGHLAPGAYRIRVTYRARKSDLGEDGWTPVVKERLQHLWTGTLASDWVPLTIQPTP